MYNDVDIFLAHFGVKGMRWGERNTKSSNSVSRAAVKQAGLQAAKIAVKYGGPPVAAGVATLSIPIALPSIAVLGLSARILADDDARAAIVSAAAYSKQLVKDMSADFERDFKYGKDITDRTEKMAPDLPKKKSGGMFNPDADISGGNIQDIGTPADQAKSGWEPNSEKSKFDWPW